MSYSGVHRNRIFRDEVEQALGSERSRKYKPPCVMMVAGEASGDLHGGALAEALLKKNPSLQIIGFGGDAMRKAGVDVLFDIERLGVIGLFEVFLHLKSLFQAYHYALELLEGGVDLLVLIDYPGFNLRLAKSAKRLGVPVVYYISPQIWAWRSGRIKKIAERVDKMLVIFPFEKQIYTAANVPCEFVGHPLLDHLQTDWPSSLSKASYLEAKGLDRSGTTVGLLPGSRKREVTTLLPIMLKGMGLLAKEFPKLQILIPVAPSLPREWMIGFTRSSSLPIRLVEGEMHQVLKASDVIVVASGTATLQAALAEVPMVIVYRLSWMTHWIARRLIQLESIGLVNIIAGVPFVPELIQGDVSPDRICKEIGRLLRDQAAHEKIKQGLKGVAASLGTVGASERAATAIYKSLEETLLMRGSEGQGSLTRGHSA